MPSKATISTPAASGLRPRKKMRVHARFRARFVPKRTNSGRCCSPPRRSRHEHRRRDKRVNDRPYGTEHGTRRLPRRLVEPAVPAAAQHGRCSGRANPRGATNRTEDERSIPAGKAKRARLGGGHGGHVPHATTLLERSRTNAADPSSHSQRRGREPIARGNAGRQAIARRAERRPNHRDCNRRDATAPSRSQSPALRPPRASRA